MNTIEKITQRNQFIEKSGITQYVLGFDIGGTNVRAGLYEITPFGLSQSPVWEMRENTRKGLTAHAQQVALITKWAHEAANILEGRLAAVAVASPGRFDEEGRIKKGTADNMGIKGDMLDEVILKDKYLLALKSLNLGHLNFTVRNDGNAMLADMMTDLLNPAEDAPKIYDQFNKEVLPSDLWKNHVALFGIGTGIGHAIAEVGNKGGFEFKTDGHASKLQIRVDDTDLPMIAKMQEADRREQEMHEKGELKERSISGIVVVEGTNNMLRAEDLFRGPTIKAMAGVGANDPLDLNNKDHIAALEFAGKYMARTIMLIRNGARHPDLVKDLDLSQEWSVTDKAIAAQTSTYLIGGGFGSSKLGKEVIKCAEKELTAIGVTGIRLVHMPEGAAATRAAATMIPEQIYRGNGRAVA